MNNSYIERESRRIQLFLYSLMVADCYVLASLPKGDAFSFFFIASLILALLAFYCWYLQDAILCSDNEQKFKDCMNKVLHVMTLVCIIISVALGLWGLASYHDIQNNTWFLMSFFICIAFIVSLHSIAYIKIFTQNAKK